MLNIRNRDEIHTFYIASRFHKDWYYTSHMSIWHHSGTTGTTNLLPVWLLLRLPSKIRGIKNPWNIGNNKLAPAHFESGRAFCFSGIFQIVPSLRRRTLYPTEVQRRVLKNGVFSRFLPLGLRLTCIIITQRVFKIQRFEISKTRCIRTTNLIWKNHLARD